MSTKAVKKPFKLYTKSQADQLREFIPLGLRERREALVEFAKANDNNYTNVYTKFLALSKQKPEAVVQMVRHTNPNYNVKERELIFNIKEMMIKDNQLIIKY